MEIFDPSSASVIRTSQQIQSYSKRFEITNLNSEKHFRIFWNCRYFCRLLHIPNSSESTVYPIIHAFTMKNFCGVADFWRLQKRTNNLYSTRFTFYDVISVTFRPLWMNCSWRFPLFRQFVNFDQMSLE